MPKTVKNLFYVLVGMMFLLIAGQIQAANVTFNADTELVLTGASPAVYASSGSECDSLVVSGATANIIVPSASTFILKTASSHVLEMTPSGGSVTLVFNTANYSGSRVAQWIASTTDPSATAIFKVTVGEANSSYRIQGGTDYEITNSDANGLLTHNHIGGLENTTFTVDRYHVEGGSGVVSGSSGGGATTPAADTTAPSISNVTDTISDTQNIIAWETNESSLSWILYGISSSFGLEEKTTSYVASHSITLRNLLPGTTYFYRIKSKDSTGNEGSYTDRVFTTLSSGQVAETVSKPISQMNNAELQAEIVRITALIVQLQSQLAGTISGGTQITGIPSSFTFKTTLKSGMVLPEVKYLQLVLNSNSDTKVANSGVGSSGNETNIFGALTKAAVIKFQNKYASEILTPLGLAQGTGIVGKATINKLNSLLGK